MSPYSLDREKTKRRKKVLCLSHGPPGFSTRVDLPFGHPVLPPFTRAHTQQTPATPLPPLTEKVLQTNPDPWVFETPERRCFSMADTSGTDTCRPRLRHLHGRETKETYTRERLCLLTTDPTRRPLKTTIELTKIV